MLNSWLPPLSISAVPDPEVNATVSGVVLSVTFIGTVIAKEMATVSPGVNEDVENALNAVLIPALLGFLAVILVQASRVI